ncbi:hypothetical protein AQULUS_04920 [Aquicella lusitana]|uniref:Uncharacterized protein n=1 Tax=Aquicella lusitana TaxID=254246 RepID=A0A370GPB8_9COXI|nr:hypothetical protein C8D86_10738 [Aquicella lusitana]VVC72770.1 hypothetical protein AQULUS_04920 [Aquicella lusitana]
MINENQERVGIEENTPAEIEEVELKADVYNNCCKFMSL